MLTSEGTAVILSILIKCPTMAGLTGALESAMTASSTVSSLVSSPGITQGPIPLEPRREDRNSDTFCTVGVPWPPFKACHTPFQGLNASSQTFNFGLRGRQKVSRRRRRECSVWESWGKLAKTPTDCSVWESWGKQARTFPVSAWGQHPEDPKAIPGE